MGEEGSQTVKPFFLGLILPRGELLAIVQTFQETVVLKKTKTQRSDRVQSLKTSQ